MHYITGVKHTGGYRLELEFEDGTIRSVDLEHHLDGEVFDLLKDPGHFRSAHLNTDIDTVVWDNGADMSPDFLYEISSPMTEGALPKVAETHAPYEAGRDSTS